MVALAPVLPCLHDPVRGLQEALPGRIFTNCREQVGDDVPIFVDGSDARRGNQRVHACTAFFVGWPASPSTSLISSRKLVRPMPT
jgi:hypothetical protein